MKIRDKWALHRQTKKIRNLPEVGNTDPKIFENENSLKLCSKCGTKLKEFEVACPSCCQHDPYVFTFDEGEDMNVCINCGTHL